MALGLGLGVGVTESQFPARLLESLTNTPTMSVGLRKLREAYTGSCIRVRRSSDDTFANIGFNGPYLDIAALMTFVGAGNGFIHTMYNQAAAGTAYDVITSTNSNQWRIVNTGVLDVNTNGTPRMFASSATSAFATTDFTTYTGNYLSGAVCGSIPNNVSNDRILSVRTAGQAETGSSLTAVLIRRFGSSQSIEQNRNAQFSVVPIVYDQLTAMGSRMAASATYLTTAAASDSDAMVDQAFGFTRITNGATTGINKTLTEMHVWLGDSGATDMDTTLASMRTYYGAA